MLECLRGYGITHEHLTTDEIASELMFAMFPTADDYGNDTIWYATIADLQLCTNCLTPITDCACCIGCGGVDADLVGSHGSWCAL